MTTPTPTLLAHLIATCPEGTPLPEHLAAELERVRGITGRIEHVWALRREEEDRHQATLAELAAAERAIVADCPHPVSERFPYTGATAGESGERCGVCYGDLGRRGGPTG